MVRGQIFLLVDDLALGVLFENQIGQSLGITDGTRDRGCRHTGLWTNDARDRKLRSILGDEWCQRGGIVILTHILPRRIFFSVNGIMTTVLDEEIRGREHIEFHTEKVVERIFFVMDRRIFAALHQRIHNFSQIVLRKNSEHIERHCADLIVLSDDEDDLVFIGRPMAVLSHELILLIEKLLIVDHLGEDA